MKRAVRFQMVFTAIVLAGGLIATAIVNHAESSALAPLSLFPYLPGAMLGCEAGFSELASDAELGNAESIQAHLSLGFHEVGRSVHFIRGLQAQG